jgi:uncharacterized protein (TIGR00255 family)
MARSMTAFARLTKNIAGKNYAFEISSYNRKGLEISLSLPKDFLALEVPIRKEIGKFAFRGQVLLRCIPEKETMAGLNLDHCSDVQKKLSFLANKLDPSYKVSFETVVSLALEEKPVSLTNDALEDEIVSSIKPLLEAWTAMKEREGALLVKQIEASLLLLKGALQKISSLTTGITEKLKAKLLEKIAALKAVGEEDRERILREVVIYAEKADVSEEITRFGAHIEEFSLLLGRKEASKGRMMDFLLQEMMREANTLSSKSGDIEVIRQALFLKQEIEKIREQGQNIE